MSKPASLAITGGEDEAFMSDKLQDYPNHVLVRQKSEQLAGAAVVSDSVISRCQVDKHGTGLLLYLKKVLNILCEQTIWSMVDLPSRNPACSLGNYGSITGSTRAWISLSRILLGTQSSDSER